MGRHTTALDLPCQMPDHRKSKQSFQPCSLDQEINGRNLISSQIFMSHYKAFIYLFVVLEVEPWGAPSNFLPSPPNTFLFCFDSDIGAVSVVQAGLEPGILLPQHPLKGALTCHIRLNSNFHLNNEYRARG